MIQRIKQFYRAMTARITAADREWVQESLPPEVQELFYAMHPADQYHALNVAKTAMDLWTAEPLGDRDLLLRAALLHDVGRVKGDLDVMGKVLAVVVEYFFPGKARQWGQAGDGWLGHMMHVYYHHPEMGALKLEALGLMQEAAIIRFHHAPPREKEPPELKLLRAADELN